MFGQIKRMLGIEGVKIDVEIIQPVNLHSGRLRGIISLITLRDSEVTSIHLKMIEKYHRGRNKEKLIDEYIIGELVLNDRFQLKKEEIIEIPFEMPFNNYQSDMDRMQKSNFFASGLVKMAKLLKGVKSEYRIEAEATVSGTKLSPISKKEILIQS